MQHQYELRWRDYYAILGVSMYAEPEVVKAAYNALAKKVHPDTSGNSDDQQMKVLNEAREILSNQQLKAEYDKAYLERYGRHSNRNTWEKKGETAGAPSGQPRQRPKSDSETPKARSTAGSQETGRTSGSKREPYTGARTEARAGKNTGTRPAADPRYEDADHKLVSWPSHGWQQVGLVGAVVIGTAVAFIAPILWLKVAAVSLAAMGLYACVETRFATQVKRAHKLAKISGVISISTALLLMGLIAAAIAAGIIAAVLTVKAMASVSKALLKAK
jgi:curved DNA-binding protein CbpA